MKKIVVSILAAVMVVSIIVTSAFAANNGAGQNFVDADGNGICDNTGTGVRCRYTDTDNDGICRYLCCQSRR